MNPLNWYYKANSKQCGPVGRDEIIRLLATGELTADSTAWTKGMENWQPIWKISDFAAAALAGPDRPRPRCVTVLGIVTNQSIIY